MVVDLETTGASPATCEITEVGAVKLRGGECLGRFQTLVNPGVAIPPEITYLTGITDAMVGPAPLIDPVLASFQEFLGDAVVVGHNVRFDLSFINAVRARQGRPPIDNPVVDTVSLARRLVRDEVRDCRLGTLSRHFRLDHQPTHRALDDALATGELLHLLLERAGTLGVLGLDDLLELPRLAAHPQAGKLRLTTRLPRSPGVYIFRDAVGHVLYVGRATNLRQRVRSYFGGDERRQVGGLLRQTAAIDHVECLSVVETIAYEARLIRRLVPRFNRQGKGWARYAYLKLTLDERFPRLSVVKRPRAGDGCLYLGPVASARTAKALVEAIETAVPLRACRGRISRSGRLPTGYCPTRSLGLRPCPCQGTVAEEEYRTVVDAVVVGLTVDPRPLLEPLLARMSWLAGSDRYEEAAEVRDRAALLARALARQRRIDSLRAAGRIHLAVDGADIEIMDGRLVAAGRGQGRWEELAVSLGPDGDPGASWPTPLPPQRADECAALASWLEGNADRVTLLDAEHGWAVRSAAIPDFAPIGGLARL